MDLQTKAPVPDGMIETAAGRVVPDTGYGRLVAALDEAHEVTDLVGMTLLGDGGGTWAFVPGDHLEDDGALNVGGETPIVVRPDSTIEGTHGGTIVWRGGHTMPDGARTERFNLDGCAFTLTWQDATRADGRD